MSRTNWFCLALVFALAGLPAVAAAGPEGAPDRGIGPPSGRTAGSGPGEAGQAPVAFGIPVLDTGAAATAFGTDPVVLYTWVRLVFGAAGPKQSTGLTAVPAGAGTDQETAPGPPPGLTPLEMQKLAAARAACTAAQSGTSSGRTGGTPGDGADDAAKLEAARTWTAAGLAPDPAACFHAGPPPRQESGPPGLSPAERAKLDGTGTIPAGQGGAGPEPDTHLDRGTKEVRP